MNTIIAALLMATLAFNAPPPAPAAETLINPTQTTAQPSARNERCEGGVPLAGSAAFAEEKGGAAELAAGGAVAALALREAGDDASAVPVTVTRFSDAGKADEPTMTYVDRMYVTGYDGCARCCGKTDGITASGVKATTNHTVAMCNDYPFGTEIYIDGLGYYTVEDRGVGRGCIDVFCEDHAACYAITGYYDCYIVEEHE